MGIGHCTSSSSDNDYYSIPRYESIRLEENDYNDFGCVGYGYNGYYDEENCDDYGCGENGYDEEDTTGTTASTASTADAILAIPAVQPTTNAMRELQQYTTTDDDEDDDEDRQYATTDDNEDDDEDYQTLFSYYDTKM